MKRVRKALVVLGALVAVGTIGYHVLEDMTLLDALYMTVTTISTVGFGEVQPLSRLGRAFTIGPILFGVSTMAWAAESMVAALLEDQVRHAWWRHRINLLGQIPRSLLRLLPWCYGRGYERLAA